MWGGSSAETFPRLLPHVGENAQNSTELILQSSHAVLLFELAAELRHYPTGLNVTELHWFGLKGA